MEDNEFYKLLKEVSLAKLPNLIANPDNRFAQLEDALCNDLAESGKDKLPQRLRAAAALAYHFPQAALWNGSVLKQTVDDIVEASPIELSTWVELFNPIRDKIIPRLRKLYRNPDELETHRSMAVSVLANYASEDKNLLADILLDADAEHLDIVFDRFKNLGRDSAQLLRPETSDGVKVTNEVIKVSLVHDRLAKREANAAITKALLDDDDSVVQLLRYNDDPRVRSYLIDRLGISGIKIDVVFNLMNEKHDIGVRRALVLSLGQFQLESGQKRQISDNLKPLYLSETDAGLHGAIEWLLRKLGHGEWLDQRNVELAADEKERDERLSEASARDKASPLWYVNRWGQTLVAIPRSDSSENFKTGSPEHELDRYGGEDFKEAPIKNSFAISAHHVTWAQFGNFLNWNEFLEELKDDREEIEAWYEDEGKTRPPIGADKPRLPANYITWHMATRYCDALSATEGLDKCYESNDLKLNGYHLPTTAEYEYAARAGTTTARYYGETDELLDKYSWYAKNAKNRTWPVGSLKPNDWGLFDVLGNLYCWCQDTNEGNDGNESALYGGMFFDQPSDVRSAYGYFRAQSSCINFIGFRVARTIP